MTSAPHIMTRFEQFPGQSAIRSGIISSIQGPTPGPASGIYYQVKVNTDAGPEVIDGVQPFNSRWPDEVDTIAAPLGEPILAIYVNGQAFFLIPEQFRMSPCPPPGGGVT